MNTFEIQRANARMPVTMAAWVCCSGDCFIGTVVNLSAGGVFIRAARELVVGVQVSVKITMDDGVLPDGMTIKGWVIHQGASGFGVKFETLAPEALTRVITILSGYYIARSVAGERLLLGM